MDEVVNVDCAIEVNVTLVQGVDCCTTITEIIGDNAHIRAADPTNAIHIAR